VRTPPTSELSRDDIEASTPGTLLRDVQRVRETGFAFAFEEALPGVSTTSVPVRGAGGDLSAVLSLTAPSTRLPRERVDELLPDVVAAAQKNSAALGWLGDPDTN
jgi:DNA-binding IclR family transcriptional regulator